MQYKTVMGTAEFVCPSREDLKYSISSMANMINKEANDGWEFHGMYPLSARIDHTLATDLKSRALGRFAGEDGDYTVNVLVFKKT